MGKSSWISVISSLLSFVTKGSRTIPWDNHFLFLLNHFNSFRLNSVSCLCQSLWTCDCVCVCDCLRNCWREMKTSETITCLSWTDSTYCLREFTSMSRIWFATSRILTKESSFSKPWRWETPKSLQFSRALLDWISLGCYLECFRDIRWEATLDRGPLPLRSDAADSGPKDWRSCAREDACLLLPLQGFFVSFSFFCCSFFRFISECVWGFFVLSPSLPLQPARTWMTCAS